MRGAARSAAATLPRRDVSGIVESRSTSDILFGALVDEKYRKSMSNARRFARESLAEHREWRSMAASARRGAKRRCGRKRRYVAYHVALDRFLMFL